MQWAINNYHNTSKQFAVYGTHGGPRGCSLDTNLMRGPSLCKRSYLQEATQTLEQHRMVGRVLPDMYLTMWEKNKKNLTRKQDHYTGILRLARA